jgi:hypothetical protein
VPDVSHVRSPSQGYAAIRLPVVHLGICLAACQPEIFG